MSISTRTTHTLGTWRRVFLSKKPQQPLDEFLEAAPPRKLHEHDGAHGLMLHRDELEYWQPHRIPVGLHSYIRDTRVRSFMHRSHRKKDQHELCQFARSGTSGSERIIDTVLNSFRKEKCVMGFWNFTASLGYEDTEDEPVDRDWEKLAFALLDGAFGKSVEVVCCLKGPNRRYKRGAGSLQTGLKYRGEEFRIQVVTPDFDNREEIAEVAWKLRQLGLESLDEKSMDYIPMALYMCGMFHRLYHSPWTGGEVLSDREIEMEWMPHTRFSKHPDIQLRMRGQCTTTPFEVLP